MVKALKWKGNSPAEGRPLRQIADVLTGVVPLEKRCGERLCIPSRSLPRSRKPEGLETVERIEGAGHGSEGECARWGEGHSSQGMAREVSSE